MGSDVPISNEDKVLLLRAIDGTRGRFGLNTPIDVLRGSRNAKIAGKFDSLECHGQGKHCSVEHWKTVGKALEEAKLVKRRCVGGKGFGRSGVVLYSVNDAGKQLLGPLGSTSNASPPLPPETRSTGKRGKGQGKGKSKRRNASGDEAPARKRRKKQMQNTDAEVVDIDPSPSDWIAPARSVQVATPMGRRRKVPLPEQPVAEIDPEKDGLRPPVHEGSLEAPTALPQALDSALMPFQRAGVAFAIRRGGRCLIGDDMGLGKTIQAIATCQAFREDWPVLVIVPNSLRYVWAEELEKWIPDIGPEGVNVVRNGRDMEGLQSGIPSFHIVSYGLLVRQNQVTEYLRTAKLKITVVDESHMIKSRDALRTKEVLRLVHESSRVLLLSGTPALARPVELFSQVQAVEPSLFRSFRAFAKRYCNPRYTPYGMDYTGAANLNELHAYLRPIMVRRFKKDVLQELPNKRRQRIPLEVDKGLLKEMEKLRHEQERAVDPEEKNRVLMQMYAETAEIKIGCVSEYIDDLLQGGCKFLVFAHHRVMLDALENVAAKRGVKSIRIDGQVDAKKRAERVRDFQSNEDVRVAILSITAAGVGITLTAASLVVFAELHWTPGILVQAEDRVHRIGQKSSVNIQYLIAAGTIDDVIWKSISRKVGIVSRMCDGRKDYLNVELCARGPSQGIEEAISQTGEISQRPQDSTCENLADALAGNEDLAVAQDRGVVPSWDPPGTTPPHTVAQMLIDGRSRCAESREEQEICKALDADEIEQTADSEGEDPVRERFQAYCFRYSRLTGRVHVLDAGGKPLGANVKVSDWEEKGCSAYPEALMQDQLVVNAMEQFLKEWKGLSEKEQRQRTDQILRLPLRPRVRKRGRGRKPCRLVEKPERSKKVKGPSPKEKKKEDKKQGQLILESLRQRLKKQKTRREFTESGSEQRQVDEEETARQVRRRNAAEDSQCTLSFEPGVLGLRINTSMVTNVHPESQAEKHGINIGWKILRIDDRPFEDKLLKEKVKSSCAFTLTFQPQMCAACGEAATEANSKYCSPACEMRGAAMVPAE